MNALTATELKVLNNMSKVLDVNVELGSKIAALISALGETGTPVNAVNATESLAITGVVKDGETVTINNPAVAGSDVYEFVADAAKTKTAPTNIAVDIFANITQASRTLTVDTQPISGDTFTIGTKTYIFVPVGTANADGEVSIGADLAGAQANIVAAINGTDGVNTAHTLVTAGAFAVNNCIITALIGGVAGDAVATTETFTAGTNVFAGVTLAGGADCSATLAVAALVAAITASDTQGVGAVNGEGDTIDLTADVAGTAGNAITLAETLANGAFDADATVLSGGVNGTVASGMKFMFDATYMYVCLAGNLVYEKNWRRVSLGSAY